MLSHLEKKFLEMTEKYDSEKILRGRVQNLSCKCCKQISCVNGSARADDIQRDSIITSANVKTARH